MAGKFVFRAGIVAAICVWLAGSVPVAHAVILASDNASNVAYAAETGGAWKGQYPNGDQSSSNPPGNDNGGTGFDPWSFSGGYHLPTDANNAPGAYGSTNHFIAGVDFASTSYNNLGAPAFGLANVMNYGGVTAAARRGFTQPLTVGDAFSANFDTPAIYDDWTFFHYPFAIITFADAAGTETLAVKAGNSAFQVYPWTFTDADDTDADLGAAAGGASIQPTDTSDGSSLKLEVTGASAGRLTFDGLQPFDVTFKAGLPKSVAFILYQNNAIATTAVDDFNGNGTVDAADYVLWRNGGPLQNETQTVGEVTPDDYTAWRTSFGNAGGPTGEHAFYFDDLKIERPGGAGSSNGAVPEPASVVLWLFGIAALARRYRR